MFDPTAAIPRLPLWFVLAYIGVTLALWMLAAVLFGRRGAFWATVAVAIAALVRAHFVFWGPTAIGVMPIVARVVIVGFICFVGWLIWLPADRLVVARRALTAGGRTQGQT
jgi:hypothetical protein